MRMPPTETAPEAHMSQLSTSPCLFAWTTSRMGPKNNGQGTEGNACQQLQLRSTHERARSSSKPAHKPSLDLFSQASGIGRFPRPKFEVSKLECARPAMLSMPLIALNALQPKRSAAKRPAGQIIPGLH